MQQLFQNFRELEWSSFNNDAERVRIKNELLATVSRIESPWETIVRLVFTQVCYFLGSPYALMIITSDFVWPVPSLL